MGSGFVKQLTLPAHQITVTTRPVFNLHVGDERSSLASKVASDAALLVEVDVGLQKLMREALRHSPPTPAELEFAISLIEDELMKVHKLVPVNAILETSDTCMWILVSAIKPDAQNEEQLSIEEVEQLFDLLAALPMGRPASIAGIPSDACFAAALLFLRELMHHLNFKSIRAFEPNGFSFK